MEIVDIKNNYNQVIKKTAKVILEGGLVVFPTDTVYGLMVDPTNKKAVEKLLNFKNRWTGKAISVAVIDKKMAMEYVKLSKNEENIYSTLLPGPFTIVSRGKHKVVKEIEAENGTLGIRIPDNKYITDLIEILGKPVTATSANLAGRKPNYSVNGFLKSLSEKKKDMIDLIVDAGKLPRNKPSTVIDLTGSEIKILRRGDLITGKTNSLISKSEKETEKIAEFLLKRQDLNNKPLVFLLSGDLGCGKTVFSRKIGKLLGVKEKITSPTFVIYNEYEISLSVRQPVSSSEVQNPSASLCSAAPLDKREQFLKKQNNKFIHMDLYKITSEKDLKEIKFLDLFSEDTVSCIEWPENMGKNYLEKLKKKVKIVSVNFEYMDEKTREIRY